MAKPLAMRLLVFLQSALHWSTMCAAYTTSTTMCVDCSTLQKFLPLSSMSSLVSLNAGPGFANEHITVMIGYPLIQSIVTEPPYDSTRGVYLNTTNITSTTLSTTGTVAFAYNDTYYTHRWWPSVGPAVPNDSAFFDARCTASTPSANTWICSSWSVTVYRTGSTIITTNATNATYSTVVTAHNLHTVVVGSMIMAPALSTTSANTTTTAVYHPSEPSFTTRTITYPATKTGDASLIKPELTRLAILTGLILCYLTS